MHANMEIYLSGEQIRDDAVAVIVATEGVADGIATLDGTVKLTSSQIPILVVTDITDITSSAAELNFTNGVTSSIQNQLNSKIENIVDDTTPTLGGNLDTGGFTISNIDGGSI